MNRILIISDEDLGTQETKAGKTLLESVTLPTSGHIPEIRKGSCCSWVQEELDAIPCVILVRAPEFKVLKGKNAGRVYDMMTLPVVITEEQGA